MSTAQEYVEAIFRRARVPLEPTDFQPDWADQPFRHKAYAGVARFPLPSGGPEPSGGQDSFTLPAMAGMLRHSYGLLSRRLRVNGNPDNADRPWYRTATWGRGTASGGGLYPAEIYWACGPSGPVLPGLYHYSTPHHAMQRLLAGDVTSHVRAALDGNQDAGGTDQYLLVTVKFWKNSFKYNSFCYHVITMDVGALLATWQAWAAAMGVRLRSALWFDEPALDDLLGVDPRDESVLAVVPLPWAAGPDAPRDGDGQAAGLGSPQVAKREIERSRTTLRFPMVEKVHRATISAQTRPPELRLPEPPATAAAPPIALPPPRPEPAALGEALRGRHSSFGTFTAQPALALGTLGTLLAAGGAGRLLNTDVREAGQGPALSQLAVFANHVAGLAPGAYRYHAAAHALVPVPGEPPAPFLQWQYFLNNYNLEQAAAVITVLVRPAPVISAVGDRGYRVVNAEVGAVAEAVYLAAAAAGTGCGAALGFDNVSLAERLGTAGTDEWPALLLLVGNERADRADADDHLVWATDGPGTGGRP
jgi:SagB-type dehydrogenase family enzyme